MALITGRLHAVTVVTPDLEASIRFYHEGLGYDLLATDVLAPRYPEMEGARHGLPYALLRAPEASHGTVRLLQAAAGANPNRPRPGARAWDPGLAVLEFSMKDPDDSYSHMTSFGAKTITPPLPYHFDNAGTLGTIDVQSYAIIAPAGEQMFLTRSNATLARGFFPGRHSAVGNVVLPTNDREFATGWFARMFDVVINVDSVCQQETVNQIIDAPADTRFQMIMMGPQGVGMGLEIEEYYVPGFTEYPVSLARTGLAMATWRVTDLAEVRRRAGESLVAEGAFPLPDLSSRDGLILRGPHGMLVEVVPAD